MLLAAIASSRAAPYSGAESCRPCHPREYLLQTESRHARALRPIIESPIAQELVKRGTEGDGLRYETNAAGIAVTAGSERGILEWAFGAGAQGITPVGRFNGQYFEHRYSYYPRTGRMALTFGHPPQASTSAAQFGLLQTAHIITACFNCHGTGVSGQSPPAGFSSIEPGVRCERCHGPGEKHIRLATVKASLDDTRRSVLNAGRLAARAQVEVCGECHRLPARGDPSPEPELEDPVNVRFSPVGLMASRCFEASKRLTCRTCHDPHSDARSRADVSYYVARCVECHAKAPRMGASCPRASRKDCLGCHMRQVSLTANLKFTDHRIRVY